ncbi:uncharacterized protein LOC134686441 [Mytilus trossulus]|uniref:uncharacterized protein LOC134686441 n=1 Tax=Mytilus trossulus TaxID=6551 RepID=UPI0030070FF3
MELYRNLFICSAILTVSAILTHGLAMGLPYWIYRRVSVKIANISVDALAYEGLFKACREYDDKIHIVEHKHKHIKECINTPDRNWLLQAPNKDWIIPERYLVSFAMGGLAMTFFSDILIASGLRSRRHIFGSSISNLTAVLLLLTVLIVYGIQSDSSAYYVAFDCEIISLILSIFSSLCRFTICRGEKNGPYERIKEKSFRVNS